MAVKTAEEIDKSKIGPAIPGIPELILRRWSPRGFDPDRQVSGEDLKKIFIAAGWAASSFNEQPWRFLVGRRGDETYKRIFDSLVEFNQLWAGNAPVLILSAAKKTFSHNSSPNDYGIHDTGAATANLALAATALGMHTHSMAGFNRQAAREAFAIPEDYDIGAVTALGYQGDPSRLPESYQKMEESPRQRKPVEQFVFSEWGQPARF